jgi:hypothetical protein
MKRLIKKAKPRQKKREMQLDIEFHFEVWDDNDDKNKEDCQLFKQWMNNQFSDWEQSILEHFLYDNGLLQNTDDEKYDLTMQVGTITEEAVEST